MAEADVTSLPFMPLDVADMPTPPIDDDPATDLDDDFLVLSHNQRQQVDVFRDEICRAKDKEEKYKLCTQIRDKLLFQHTGLELLFAVFDRIIFSTLAEYTAWKNRDSIPTEFTHLKGDEAARWDKFIAVAKKGSDKEYSV
jgi:hypothetical protein